MSLLEDYRGPLVALNESAAYFDLPPLPPLRFVVNVLPEAASEKASFENLSEERLLVLRNSVYTETDVDTAAYWAETLMRFCEVRYSSLKKRALRKWGDGLTAQLHMLHLGAFLLDYALYSKDLRFLNTVLKLLDLRWIIRRGAVERDLRRSGTAFVCALFQVRLVLISEHATGRVSEGKAI